MSNQTAIPSPIAYCFDSKFADFAAVSTATLLNTNTTLGEIYWIHDDAAVARVRKLLSQEPFTKANIKAIRVSSAQFATFPENGHIKRAAYIRLLLPELIDADQVLYLDSDTLVLGDISELLRMNLKNKTIAGVLDTQEVPQDGLFRKPGDPYINSGVLLMNLRKMRRRPLVSTSIEIIEKYRHHIRYADQCVINKYAEEDKVVLDKAYNTQIFSATSSPLRELSQRFGLSNTKILHFIGEIKPWSPKADEPIAHLYWKSGSLAMSSQLMFLRFAQKVRNGALKKAVRPYSWIISKGVESTES